jgi:peptidoglycan/LPS O-acetylase OafA/YrhL
MSSPPLETTRAVRGRGRSRRSGQRADIQGLRAVAVVSVVAIHLTGHPVGGFVGVDVFFVISGFLITGHLLRDLPTTSHLGTYVGDFYRRRVRRLMPASLLVLALTVVCTRLLTGASRYQPTQHDAGWAAVFWANWHFASTGTDYFNANRPTSPVQHYWSLSVEEQFYVVWPILLFLVVRALARRAASRATIAAVLAGALSLASLVYAIPQSHTHVVSAYYSTFTRAWELGLGALLAAAAPYLVVPRRWTSAMSYLGLSLIVVALFTTHGGAGFPAPGALLACTGTAMALAAHRRGSQTRNPLLTNPVAVFVGDTSYSIYLVHFPVIILLQTRMTEPNGYFYGTALALTAGITVLIYALVEQPVLRSQWLMKTGDRRSRDDPSDANRRARRDRTVVRRRQSVVAGATACFVGLATYAAWPGEGARYQAEYQRIRQAQQQAQQRAQQQRAHHQPAAAHRHRASKRIGPKLAALQTAIRSALLARHYPPLQPSMDSVIAGPQATPRFVTCSRITLLPAARCTWGDPHARHLIYLTGDSTAMVYAEALAAIVEHTPGWRLRVASAYGCRFSAGHYVSDLPSVQAACPAHGAAVVADIARTRPDVLVVSNNYSNGTLLGHSSPLTPQQSAAVERAQLAKVRSAVGRIVVVAPPPGGADPALCYHPGASPVGCVYRPPGHFRRMSPAMEVMAAAVHGTYVDSTPWFCDQGSGYCPPFVGHVPVMHDAAHACPAYMAMLWPVIDEALTRAGVLRRH